LGVPWIVGEVAQLVAIRGQVEELFLIQFQ
jgi:hypothetical protein